MKVRQLIEELYNFDENLEVRLEVDSFFHSVDSIQEAETEDWLILRGY